MYVAWKWARLWAVGFTNALIPPLRHKAWDIPITLCGDTYM